MRAWAFVAGRWRSGAGASSAFAHRSATSKLNLPWNACVKPSTRNSGEREQTGQQMADGISHGIKVAECLGFKVYSDPQPVGHPPSAAECADLQKESARIDIRPPASSKLASLRPIGRTRHSERRLVLATSRCCIWAEHGLMPHQVKSFKVSNGPDC